MALFGFAFLALLVLGFATCIVGLAIWTMSFALPIGMMAASLATTNDTMKGEDVAQRRYLDFISRQRRRS
ncbi:MAG TPA: hypothetical protein VIS99_11490 [Terrimicrobiaceae bacterium]